jgi:Xaa-Pro aminopeptidase
MFDTFNLRNDKRIERLVEESGLEAVIATSLENVTYLSGYYNPQMRVLTDRMYIVIWPAQKNPVLIAPGHGPENILIRDVRGYDFYARDVVKKDYRERSHVDQSPIPLLSKTLRDMGFSKSRIGIEKMHFPVQRYEELRDLLPSIEIVDCGSVFDEIRMIKTEAEIKLLQKAGKATEKAIRIGFETAGSGDSLKSIADAISSAILNHGADRVAFIELEAMSGGKRYDYLEENKILESGDLIKVDAGGYFHGYYSDVARMAVVGPPEDSQRSFYERLKGVHEKIIGDVIMPCHSGKELLKKANNAFKEFGFRPHPRSIAHGLGLYIHERPWIREAETYKLEPGNVICVETINVREDPNQMWHIEDLIHVTEDGAKKLTTYSSTDELYIIK